MLSVTLLFMLMILFSTLSVVKFLICGNHRDALHDLVHLYNSKNVKKTHEWVLLLETLQAKAFNFTKSNTPP